MGSATGIKNQKFLLKSRPQGRVRRSDFEMVEESLAELKEGEILVRNIYLSVDPTNRIWMSDIEQYMPPVSIGEVMRCLGIGRVEESKNPRFPEGSLVSGLIGWQRYVITTGEGQFPLSIVPPVKTAPLTALVGVLGMTGMTAYFGLLEVGKPEPGETLVVSAAAGAVGSVVGQIGKLKGLNVVGIAGGEKKCGWLKNEVGFDHAIDYKDSGFLKNLEKATPNGVDINFENVGGEIMEAVYSRMNLRSRFVLCGMISGYNSSDDSRTRISLTRTLMKRITIQGFIISDFASSFQKAANELASWLDTGKIKHRETIVDGLDNAPEALNMLFDGNKEGKLLIKVSDE